MITKFLNDDFFAPEPLTQREAAIWLLEQGTIDNTSGRRLAALWRWSEPRVRKFLARLEGAGWVSVKRDKGGIRIIALITLEVNATPSGVTKH